MSSQLQSQELIENFPDITFRELIPEDVIQIQQLQSILFPIQYPARFYNSLFKENYHNIVAFSNTEDKVVGVVTSRINEKGWSVCTSDLEGYIMTLGVDPKLRRRGVGSFLLRNICSILFQEGCSSIQLHVLCSNEGAVHFYQRESFQISQRLVDYYTFDGKNHDAYFMKLFSKQQSSSKNYYLNMNFWNLGYSCLTFPYSLLLFINRNLLFQPSTSTSQSSTTITSPSSSSNNPLNSVNYSSVSSSPSSSSTLTSSFAPKPVTYSSVV